MSDHPGILKHRIQALAIGDDLGFGVEQRLVIAALAVQHDGGEERDGDCQDRDGHLVFHALFFAIEKDERRAQHRQQPRPQQQTAFLPGPERRDLIAQRQRSLGESRDIPQAEIAGYRGGHQRAAGDGQDQRQQVDPSTGGTAQILRTRPYPRERNQESYRGHQDGRAQTVTAYLGDHDAFSLCLE